MNLCRHELLPESCDYCNPRTSRSPRRVLTARHSGRCAGCSAPIEPGDVIAPNPGEDGWLCEECA